jgi:hypothetical protein
MKLRKEGGKINPRGKMRRERKTTTNEGRECG